MISLSKRIISVICLVVTIFFAVPIANADYTNTAFGFWEQTLRSCVQGADSLLGGTVSGSIGLYVGPVCPTSGDTYHHTPTLKGCSIGEDEHGMYANATCQYCGEPFRCYSSDLKDSYNQYVDTLPATGYDSTGGLIWKPTFEDCSLATYDDVTEPNVPYYAWFYLGGKTYSVLLSNWPLVCEKYGNYCIYSLDESRRIVNVEVTSSSMLQYFGTPKYSFIAPVSGSYTLLSGPAASFSGVATDGSTVQYNRYYTNGTTAGASAGGTLTLASNTLSIDSVTVASGRGKQYFPTFRIVPLVYDDGPDYSITYYDNSTRVGNIIFDYGVKNEDKSAHISGRGAFFMRPM